MAKKTKKKIITDKELFSFLRELVLSVQKNRKAADTKKPVRTKAKIKKTKKSIAKKSTHPKKRTSYRYTSGSLGTTGISSQNIGETQHAESPQTSLFIHIPRSTPAANISGSNAYSSMRAQIQKKSEKKTDSLVRPQTKAPVSIKKTSKYRKFSHNKKRLAYSGLQSLIHKPDSTALDYGGHLGPMSGKHGHREKNKKKKLS